MHPTARSRTTLGLSAAALLTIAGASLGLSQPSAPEAAPAQPAPQPAAQPPEAALDTTDEPGEEPEEEEPEAVVLLKDGQRMSGFLIEQTDERVVLRVGGISTTIERELVDRVMVLPPIEERYRAIREAIGDGDTDQLLRLAEWLRARGRFADAIHELDHVLSLEPENADAKRLRLLAAQQEMLREKAREAREARENAAPGGRPAAADPADPFPLLTEEQINLIRVYEVDLAAPPRMLVDRDVVTRLLTEHAGHPQIPVAQADREALYRRRPAEILELMFRLQARELYGEVEVLEDPASLESFRDDVHRGWLMNTCATTRCHGGKEAGRLALATRRRNSDATVYTNFLILDRFRMPDGTPLINYEEPSRSMLLHLGLPREDSLYPHPPVPGVDGRGDAWRAAFRGPQDRRFREAVEWIQSMYRPRPEYPIDYTPPGQADDAAQPEGAAAAPEPAPPR